MTSYIRRAGQELTRLIARATNPNAETDIVTGYAKPIGPASALSRPAQLFARSPDYPRQVSGTECNIFSRPLEPHAYDDEFESTTLDPAWTAVAPLVPGNLDPYSTLGNQLYQLHTDRRASWIMVQGLGGVTISKQIAFAGDFFVWMRGSFNARTALSPVNNDAGVRLDLSTDPRDTNNLVAMSINEQDAGTIQAEFSTVVGGAITVVGNTANMFSGTAGLQAIEAVGIQKIGTTYHGWAFGRGGHGIWLGSTVFAPAIGTCGLVFPGVSTAAPGVMIQGADFVRFKESSTWLP